MTACGDPHSDSPPPFTTNQVFSPSTNTAPSPAQNALSANSSTNDHIRLAEPQSHAFGLRDALHKSSSGDYAGALKLVDDIIKNDPANIPAYTVRGSIHSKMKSWDLAKEDYDSILQLDSNNTIAHFNLYEIEFMQKKYADARPGFVSLEHDLIWGDLASYKVFLCDLFGGHEEVAQGELATFDKTADEPSYYYANAAWFLFRQRPDDARPWLDSAAGIYAPEKASLYTSSLEELGYLPLPRK